MAKPKTIHLNDLVKIWQQRLRLQDWDITVTIKRRYEIDEMANSSVLGLVRIADNFLKATIVLMDPQDFSPDDDTFEQVLVHEMVHILLPWMDLGIKNDDTTAEFRAYERRVDRLADILVGAFNK